MSKLSLTNALRALVSMTLKLFLNCFIAHLHFMRHRLVVIQTLLPYYVSVDNGNEEYK